MELKLNMQNHDQSHLHSPALSRALLRCSFLLLLIFSIAQYDSPSTTVAAVAGSGANFINLPAFSGKPTPNANARNKNRPAGQTTRTSMGRKPPNANPAANPNNRPSRASKEQAYQMYYDELSRAEKNNSTNFAGSGTTKPVLDRESLRPADVWIDRKSLGSAFSLDLITSVELPILLNIIPVGLDGSGHLGVALPPKTIQDWLNHRVLPSRVPHVFTDKLSQPGMSNHGGGSAADNSLNSQTPSQAALAHLDAYAADFVYAYSYAVSIPGSSATQAFEDFLRTNHRLSIPEASMVLAHDKKNEEANRLLSQSQMYATGSQTVPGKAAPHFSLDAELAVAIAESLASTVSAADPDDTGGRIEGREYVTPKPPPGYNFVVLNPRRSWMLQALAEESPEELRQALAGVEKGRTPHYGYRFGLSDEELEIALHHHHLQRWTQSMEDSLASTPSKSSTTSTTAKPDNLFSRDAAQAEIAMQDERKYEKFRANAEPETLETLPPSNLELREMYKNYAFTAMRGYFTKNRQAVLLNAMKHRGLIPPSPTLNSENGPSSLSDNLKQQVFMTGMNSRSSGVTQHPFISFSQSQAPTLISSSSYKEVSRQGTDWASDLSLFLQTLPSRDVLREKIIGAEKERGLGKSPSKADAALTASGLTSAKEKPKKINGFTAEEFAFFYSSLDPLSFLQYARSVNSRESCLSDSYVGSGRTAFLDLAAGPFSAGPVLGGEGMKSPLTMPSIDTLGAQQLSNSQTSTKKAQGLQGIFPDLFFKHQMDLGLRYFDMDEGMVRNLLVGSKAISNADDVQFSIHTHNVNGFIPIDTSNTENPASEKGSSNPPELVRNKGQGRRLFLLANSPISDDEFQHEAEQLDDDSLVETLEHLQRLEKEIQEQQEEQYSSLHLHVANKANQENEVNEDEDANDNHSIIRHRQLFIVNNHDNNDEDLHREYDDEYLQYLTKEEREKFEKSLYETREKRAYLRDLEAEKKRQASNTAPVLSPAERAERAERAARAEAHVRLNDAPSSDDVDEDTLRNIRAAWYKANPGAEDLNRTPDLNGSYDKYGNWVPNVPTLSEKTDDEIAEELAEARARSEVKIINGDNVEEVRVVETQDGRVMTEDSEDLAKFSAEIQSKKNSEAVQGTTIEEAIVEKIPNSLDSDQKEYPTFASLDDMLKYLQDEMNLDITPGQGPPMRKAGQHGKMVIEDSFIDLPGLDLFGDSSSNQQNQNQQEQAQAQAQEQRQRESKIAQYKDYSSGTMEEKSVSFEAGDFERISQAMGMSLEELLGITAEDNEDLPVISTGDGDTVDNNQSQQMSEEELEKENLRREIAEAIENSSGAASRKPADIKKTATSLGFDDDDDDDDETFDLVKWATDQLAMETRVRQARQSVDSAIETRLREQQEKTKAQSPDSGRRDKPSQPKSTSDPSSADDVIEVTIEEIEQQRINLLQLIESPQCAVPTTALQRRQCASYIEAYEALLTHLKANEAYEKEKAQYDIQHSGQATIDEDAPLPGPPGPGASDDSEGTPIQPTTTFRIKRLAFYGHTLGEAPEKHRERIAPLEVESFMSSLSSVISKLQRSVITPPAAVLPAQAKGYAEEIVFSVRIIKNHNAYLPMPQPFLAMLQQALMDLRVAGQSASVTIQEFAMHEDPVLTAAYSSATKFATIPSMLFDGSYTVAKRQYLDSALLTRELMAHATQVATQRFVGPAFNGAGGLNSFRRAGINTLNFMDNFKPAQPSQPSQPTTRPTGGIEKVTEAVADNIARTLRGGGDYPPEKEASSVPVGMTPVEVAKEKARREMIASQRTSSKQSGPIVVTNTGDGENQRVPTHRSREIPIYLFSLSSSLPVFIDKRFQAKAVSSGSETFVIAVQSNHELFETSITCNNEPVLRDLMNPLQAIVQSSMTALSGVLPTHVSSSPAVSTASARRAQATSDWTWSSGSSPAFALNSADHRLLFGQIEKDTAARNLVISALRKATALTNAAIMELRKTRTSVANSAVLSMMYGPNTVDSRYSHVPAWEGKRVYKLMRKALKSVKFRIATVRQLVAKLDYPRALAVAKVTVGNAHQFASLASMVVNRARHLDCTCLRESNSFGLMKALWTSANTGSDIRDLYSLDRRQKIPLSSADMVSRETKEKLRFAEQGLDIESLRTTRDMQPGVSANVYVWLAAFGFISLMVITKVCKKTHDIVRKKAD